MSKTNNRINQLIKAVLLAAAVTFTPFVHAMPVHDGDKPKTDQMVVSMAGATEAEILVDVKISNEEGKRFILVIENERGDEVFRKEIDKSGFYSRLKFPKDDNYITEYTIKLRVGTKPLEKYRITTTPRVVQDITISKL